MLGVGSELSVAVDPFPPQPLPSTNWVDPWPEASDPACRVVCVLWPPAIEAAEAVMCLLTYGRGSCYLAFLSQTVEVKGGQGQGLFSCGRKKRTRAVILVLLRWWLCEEGQNRCTSGHPVL